MMADAVVYLVDHKAPSVDNKKSINIYPEGTAMRVCQWLTAKTNRLERLSPGLSCLVARMLAPAIISRAQRVPACRGACSWRGVETSCWHIFGGCVAWLPVCASSDVYSALTAACCVLRGTELTAIGLRTQVITAVIRVAAAATLITAVITWVRKPMAVSSVPVALVASLVIL